MAREEQYKPKCNLHNVHIASHKVLFCHPTFTGILFPDNSSDILRIVCITY